jgi:hypothetical protein
MRTSNSSLGKFFCFTLYLQAASWGARMLRHVQARQRSVNAASLACVRRTPTACPSHELRTAPTVSQHRPVTPTHWRLMPACWNSSSM